MFEPPSQTGARHDKIIEFEVMSSTLSKQGGSGRSTIDENMIRKEYDKSLSRIKKKITADLNFNLSRIISEVIICNDSILSTVIFIHIPNGEYRMSVLLKQKIFHRCNSIKFAQWYRVKSLKNCFRCQMSFKKIWLDCVNAQSHWF